jgi:superfamily II RNA helicase
MELFEGLQQKVKETVNAPRRAAQRELEMWKNKHIGQRWYALEKEVWSKYKRDVKELASLQRDLVALKEPERDVMPVLKALEEFGFMKDGELTPLGTMSTEVNEGHSILMPLFWLTEIRRELTPEETLATLAVFLGEGDANQNEVSSFKVSACIDELKTIAKKCLATEEGNRVMSPTTHFWTISTEYVEIIWKWLYGTSLAEIALEYGMFEGNLIRLLTKLQSILEEWRILATLNKDTETLNNLADAEALLKIGYASSESLYLRI